jgi:signal transduction histidine kinase
MTHNCCSHLEAEGKYQLKLAGDHHTTVYADQHKIEQVLINLVNNAVKYAPGSLTITIGVEQTHSGVKITVADQGPGIAAEDVSQLFDRYFRVNKSRHSTSGLGLGLYISSEIIRRHGGQMGVDSVEGKGASFWFTLPAQP